MAARQTASCLPSPADAFASLPLRARGLSVVLSPLQAIMRRFKPLPGAMAGCCVSDPVVAPSLTPPLAAQDSGSMPEPSNEGPAKSGRKRGRSACAPANRRPFRTLDGTKQAKASTGKFFVLFAAKKYKVSRRRNPRLTAGRKAAEIRTDSAQDVPSDQIRNAPGCAAGATQSPKIIGG